MNTVSTESSGRQTDGLTIALFIAALLHAFVLLGVSFHPFLDNIRTPPALEVLLVTESAENTPVEEAAYLAQSNQDGGGETEDNTRPSSPFTSALAVEADGVAPTPITPSAPEPVVDTTEEVVTALYSETEVETRETTENSEELERPEAEVLVDQSADIARLAAEIDRQQEEMAKRPRKKFLNARTRESASAEYMYRWVRQVERVGNLNYPDEARRRQLFGELILIVGVFKNGDLESITIDESSGHKLLDDAAVRIVELAAPFEPMTGRLAEETDILYIVRTWEFTANNSVDSR